MKAGRSSWLEADCFYKFIWRLCANHDGTKWNHGMLLAAGLAGIALLFAGCGDDLEAMVPAAEAVIVQGETSEAQESASAEDNHAEETDESGISEHESQEQIDQEKNDASENDNSTAETVDKSLGGSQENTEEITITISAVGDCSLGNHLQQDYYYSFNQAYDKAEDEGYFFANVKDIFEADDMTIVNLEGVLSDSQSPAEGRTYNIKGAPSYAGILTAGSVEAVSMGNNHRLDYGVSGSNDTVEALEAEDIVYAYDDIVGIYEVKGIKIGYVSVNEVSWGYGSQTIIEEGIAQLKEQEADLIIACCHWGVEKDNYTEEYQNKLGRICIDAGADLVLGHHPHVLQGIEEYNGKYIVYSLANFSFGANRNPADKDTMIFQQTFTFLDGEKQETTEARVIPCSVSSVTERNNFQPTPLTGEEAARVIGRLNTYSEEYGVVIGEDGTIE